MRRRHLIMLFAASLLVFNTACSAGGAATVSQAERTGNSTDNFIAWVNECMN